MYLWSNTESSNVDIETLAQVICEAGRPVHVNNLAREFVRWGLLAVRKEVRRYSPSATYAVGDKVRWKGKLGEVKAVKDGENPRQGKFSIINLVLPDGGEIRLAAVGEYGLVIRTAIQDAMRKDARFVWFEDAQGDNWCLTEMLPEVRDEDLAKVFPFLQGLLKDGALPPRPTEELVKTIWGQENDGSDEYALKSFALNVALQGCNDTRWMGNGWVLESEWQKLQEREALIGPRQPSKIEPPEGVTLDTSDEPESAPGEVEEEEEPEEQEAPIPEDLEAWRRNRRLHANFTLQARHYYGNYLPLNKDMRRVFPPRASGSDAVTFYHHFGDEQESFQAWVDWNQKRILGSPQMYQAFYDYGIYPGAVLVISHRENEQEYDIRTKPPTKDEPVRVRRVFFATDEYGNRILGEDGHPKLEYEEDNEPRLYEIADEVFIVGASWENLPELFAEAERVGQGYFGLMYEVGCEWWEANGRKPLYVTADELFQEIHYNRRLVTSEATIPWELWRRLAFKPVGSGRYLFRPQMGDRTRDVGPRSRPSRTLKTRRGIQVKRDKSLLEIVKQSAEKQRRRQFEAEQSKQTKIIHIEPKPEVSQNFLYPIPFLEHEIDLQLKRDIQRLLRLGADETTLFPVADVLFTSAVPKSPESLDRRLIQFYPDKSKNRFVTPREVADLMVNLAQPTPGEKIVDICCGTGIFLVKALNFVRQRSSSEADLKLFGVDKEANGAEATKISLTANSAKDFKVICGDSLSDDLELLNDDYDLILGNPPFGRNIEVNFLKKWAQLVGEGGKMVVNTADGVLTNTSTRNIRDWLVENFNIRAVISLPRPSDSETYGAKSNVLVLQNDENSKQQPTLIAEITDYEDIPVVIRRFLEMDTSREVNVGETVVVSEKEPMIVLKNQEDLRERMDPGFWNPKYEVLTKIRKFGSRRLAEIVADGPTSGWRAGAMEYISEAGVAIIKVGDIIETGVDWSRVRFVSETHPAAASVNRRIQPYDILICRSGEGGAGKGKLSFVANLRYPSCVHGHVYRMQLSERSQAPSIVVFLKSQFGKLQIERYVSGVGSPELDADDILGFEAPILPNQIQNDIEAEYHKVSQFHDTAIEAKERGDAVTYRNNINTAEKMLNNLVQQLEEIIEGKREEIEPVDT